MFIKNKILFSVGILFILTGIGVLIYNQVREPNYLAYTKSDFSNTEESKIIEDTKPINESEKSSKKKRVTLKDTSIQVEDTKIPVEKIELKEPIKAKKNSIKPTENNTTKAEEEIQPEVKEQHFYIISGVYSVEENADLHVENLKKEGYSNALVIGKVNGLFNVSFGTYSSREIAEKELNTIKEKFQSSAWILYI